ncbi:MAG: XRE family transcriptional regulator [Eubacteriales bacterium]
MKQEQRRRKKLIGQMEHLANAKVNDGVKLAYLTPEQLDIIDDLDLTALTEFKRNGNGAVEMKFNDRMKAVEQLLAFTDRQSENEMESLLSALVGGGEEG